MRKVSRVRREIAIGYLIPNILKKDRQLSVKAASTGGTPFSKALNATMEPHPIVTKQVVVTSFTDVSSFYLIRRFLAGLVLGENDIFVSHSLNRRGYWNSLSQILVFFAYTRFS